MVHVVTVLSNNPSLMNFSLQEKWKSVVLVWFIGVISQVDEGGSKRFFQNMWTSFLKARLVCGFPEESLYFNRLQDIFVMPAEQWQDTRVYALFTSSWWDTFPSFIISNYATTWATRWQSGPRFKLQVQHFPMFFAHGGKTKPGLQVLTYTSINTKEGGLATWPWNEFDEKKIYQKIKSKSALEVT